MSTHIENWLASDSDKLILIDIQYYKSGVLNTLNVASAPYVMAHGEIYTDMSNNSVYNLVYNDVLLSIPTITSKIDSSFSIGALNILNTDAAYDFLVSKDTSISGHRVQVYIGSRDWDRNSFILVLDGITSEVSAPSVNNITIGIRDRKELLNVDAQNKRLTQASVVALLQNSSFNGDVSSDTNASGYPRTFDATIAVLPESLYDAVIPICLGYCFNITPTLIDVYNHVYQIHESNITQVIEVRSNGVKLISPTDVGTTQYQIDLSIGCIRLLVNDMSTGITCDVIGNANRPTGADTNYSLVTNSAASAIEWLVLEKTELLNTQLDYSTFTNINSSAIGIFITEESTVMDICINLMRSIGGYTRFSKLYNKYLQLYVLEDPVDKTVELYINSDDVVKDGLSLLSITHPSSAIEFGYAKNWTIQDSSALAGVVIAGDINLITKYSTEYTVYSIQDISSSIIYPARSNTKRVDSAIAYKVDAEAEALRRSGIISKPKHIYKINTTLAPFTVNTGTIINIKHIRYGFSGRVDELNYKEVVTGRNAVIIGIEEVPTENRVILEVWL